MSKSLLLQGCEILFNSLKDLTRLAIAKLAYQPLGNVVIALARIATLTSRNNVTGYGSCAVGIRQRNDMIGGQLHRVKQSLLITAVSATVIEPIQSILPLLASKCYGILPLSLRPSVGDSAMLLRMSESALTRSISELIWIAAVCYAVSFAHAITFLLIFIMAACLNSDYLRLIAVACISKTLIFVVGVITRVFAASALGAKCFYTFASTGVFAEFRSWIPDMASIANFTRWNRCVNHDRLPYCPYVRKCGKAIGLAVQTVNYSVLSHLLIIPQTALMGVE